MHLSIIPDDDDVYLKKITTIGCHKMHYPTQKCRPAKGISKRVNIQIIQDRQNSLTINNPNIPQMKK
jgi:hypothetical protein